MFTFFKLGTQLFVLLILMVGCSSTNSSKPQNFSEKSIVTVVIYDESKNIVQKSRGFFVESDGFLLTSYKTLLLKDGYTLANDVEISLSRSSRIVYEASIVAVEPTLNFAILKISPQTEIVPVSIAPREHIHASEDIFTFESTQQDKPNFLRGTIENLNAKECYQESMTGTMLEVELKIPDKLLGSPVYNSLGEVIGLHTGYSPADGHTDEQYILPIFLAFNIYESIKDKKSFISPWTGFSVRPLSKQEQSLFPFKRLQGGIGIEYVWKDSPAEKLGIKVDDILLKFSYYPTPSPAEFQKWLYAYGVGGKVTLHILRNKQEYLTVDYQIEARPDWAVPK